MEIMLARNSYFLFYSHACLIVIVFLKEGLISTTMWGYLSSPGIQDLILLRISLQQCQFGFTCLTFPWNSSEKTSSIKLLLW